MSWKNTILDKIFDQQLTFLVGAGCSVDPPSCLPTGYEMMKAIIGSTCDHMELNKLLNLEGLRFELLLDIIRNRIDPGLSIIDYFSLPHKPNIHHLFFAEMIRRGHFVITTNFDHLIELALLRLGQNPENILPVITKSDFTKYSAIGLLRQGDKKPVIKIHGSATNIITKENTRESLITTITSLGQNKEETSIFQIEPFKRDLIENCVNGRSLIILGYSGSDDFDIIPTIRTLKNIQNLIWVDHNQELEETISIHEIHTDGDYAKTNSIKVVDILSEIKRVGFARQVFLVEAHTGNLIRKACKRLGIGLNLDVEPFPVSLREWVKSNFVQITEIDRLYISARIYRSLCHYSDALRILESIGERIKNQFPFNQHEYSFLNNELGDSYFQIGNYQQSLKSYEMALENCTEPALQASIYTGIGLLKFNMDQHSDSLNYFEAALKIDEMLGDLESQGISLNNIATVYDRDGDFDKALEYYQKSLSIYWSLPMYSRSIRLNNIARIYSIQGKFESALENYKEALNITKELGDLAKTSTVLDNIGAIYFRQQQYDTALSYYNDALELASKIGFKYEEIAALFNIGSTFHAQGENEKSLGYFERALTIADQFNSYEWKAKIRTMLEIVKKDGTYLLLKEDEQNEVQIPISVTLEKQKAAHRILRRLENTDEAEENPENIITKYTEIGHAYLDSYQLEKALGAYDRVYQAGLVLNDLEAISASLGNIGNVYIEMNDLARASEFIQKAYDSYNRNKDFAGMARQIGNMGVIDIRNNRPKEALEHFQSAYELLKELGDHPEEEQFFLGQIAKVKKLYNLKA